VICVGLSTVNDVAATVPNRTEVAPWKPVPVITTLVAPTVQPAVGTTDVTAGTLMFESWYSRAKTPEVSSLPCPLHTATRRPVESKATDVDLLPG